MKRLVFLSCLLPSLALASFADTFNGLLERFFGDAPAPTVSEPAPMLDLDIPQIDLPDNPTTADVTDMRQQIMTEEEELADFETKLNTTEEKLWSLTTEKSSLNTQLQQLDEQLGLTSQRVELLQTKTNEWQQQLDQITAEKSALQALIRVRERQEQQQKKTAFIRGEHFSNSRELSVLRWLFSGRTMSEVLEENQQQRRQVDQISTELTSLRELKHKLDAEEKRIALLYHHTQNLLGRVAAEKKTLREFTQAKARLVARLEYSQGQAQKEMETYQKQRVESTVYLQNLRQALSELKDQVDEPAQPSEAETPIETARFAFPLQIPMKITATFRDKSYRERFGREHDGVDFFALQGTPIYAPAEGTVRRTASNGYGYSYIILEHEPELYTVYGHVSAIDVVEGQTVSQGDQIGLTGGTPGTTGAGYFTTGPHLHWEVFAEGEFVDPMEYLPPVKQGG